MRILIVFLIAFAANAQTSTKSPLKSDIPRGADGKPDLTGVWQGGSTRAGNWADANSGTGLGGTGVDPNAPVLPSSSDRQTREGAPYQPWAAKKVLESFNRRGIDDPTARCLPAGIPRGVVLGLFPQQFIQTPTQLVILYEYMMTFRVIPLNTTKHADDAEPSYLGDSVAHWEGDTLVIDVTSFNDKTWLIGAGTFHSEALHITEKYTRVSKDRINYQAIMEDPNVFTKPWVIESSLMLREGTRVREYPCNENNEDIVNYQRFLKEGVNFSRQ